MRLINKKAFIGYKVFDRIYWKEYNIWDYNNNIWYRQNVDVGMGISSTSLLSEIYDEVNR